MPRVILVIWYYYYSHWGRYNFTIWYYNYTATGDYQELVNVTLVFPAESSERSQLCEVVKIIGDEKQEENETFTVDLRTQNRNDVLTTMSFTVVIIDDDKRNN